MASFVAEARQSFYVWLIRFVSGVHVYFAALPRSWTSTIQIKTREPGRYIPAHIYPSTQKSCPSPPGPVPVLLNWHGSSFILNLQGTDDAFCSHVAATTPFTVLDLTYRLAPEHQYPACVEDAEDALNYVFAHPELYDASRIAVSGFSAGGYLALLMAGGAGGKIDTTRIRACVAFYPCVDLDKIHETKKAPEDGGSPMPAWLMYILDKAYLGPGVDRKDPRVSPTFASPDSFCDEIAIFTCGHDNLAPEGEALAEKLRGVKKLTAMRIDSVGHGWDKQPDADGLKKRDMAYGKVTDILNALW